MLFHEGRQGVLNHAPLFGYYRLCWMSLSASEAAVTQLLSRPSAAAVILGAVELGPRTGKRHLVFDPLLPVGVAAVAVS